MVDVARDQRWGRGVEGGGEDVLLGELFAAARVRGFQGTDLRSNEHVLATAKHFAAYGAAEAGLDYNSVDVSERTLREVYLPPFKAAFDAGAMATMAAFNEISGIPATANEWLLTQLLRREWGFQGFVVSDYTGDEELIAHGLAADAREATSRAFDDARLHRFGPRSRPQIHCAPKERRRAVTPAAVGQTHRADRAIRQRQARSD